MLALFGRDEYSLLGIACLLDVEKIPYRLLTQLQPCDGDLLVAATPDLSSDDLATLERQPWLVLNGGARFAQQICGAVDPHVRTAACSIAVDEPVWPRAVTDLARHFGTAALRIPRAPMCTAAAVSKGTVLASFAGADDGTARAAAAPPAIVQFGHGVWSAIDLGAAFANLLTESYGREVVGKGRHFTAPAWLRRVSENTYYAAPDRVRRWVQSRYYAHLERRLERQADFVSDYPIDASGWLLIELVKRLITLAAGGLVHVARWPAPYRAAATLTHDIEPRRYAYTTGLDRLLQRAAVLGHPATVSLVAEASDRYLCDAAVSRLQTHDLLCHGLAHRGEPVHGRARVSVCVQTARMRLERRLGRPVAGYRSPRLDRSPDLAWALDHSGFEYDSSYPDVDRENIEHFGGGVRLNVPYRPLIHDAAGGTAASGLRRSRCLELPLTAPDCIQPLYGGQTVAALRAAVVTKAAFVRATGGIYVALVHAGVFGDHDAAVREEHLEFVYRQLQHAEVWLATLGQIAAWWRQREALRIFRRDGVVVVHNHGTQQIAGVQVVIERDGAAATYTLPPLAAGGETMV